MSDGEPPGNGKTEMLRTGNAVYYSLAMALVMTALAVSLLLDPIFASPPYFLYFGAVMVTIWYGGLSPGLAALFLSISVIMLVPADESLKLSISDGLQLSIYGVGLLSTLHLRGAKRRAEVSLQYLRAYLEQIVNSIDEAVLINDVVGRIEFANPAAARLFGYLTTDAILGRSIRTVTSHLQAYDQKGLLLSLPDLLGYKTDTLEMIQSWNPIRLFDEKKQTGRWVFIKVSVIVGIQDELPLTINILTDNTVLVEQEMQITQEQERLQDLLGSVPGIVWENWDDTAKEVGKADYVSDYVEKMLGYTAAEWLSTPEFWLSIVHPDDRSRAQQEREMSKYSGEQSVSQFRCLTREGEVIWVEAQSVMIVEAGGQPIGVRGIMLDISQRKRFEQAQRTLAEVGDLLASSLNYHGSLSQVAEVIVRDITAACMITLHEGDQLRVAAAAHTDPLMSHSMAEASRLVREELSTRISDAASHRVIEHDLENALAEVRRENYQSEQDFKLKRAFSVPLIIRNSAIGFLTLLEPDVKGEVSDEREALAQELSRRIAIAVDNAHLHASAQISAAQEERQRLARELHDAVSQTLFSANMIAQSLPRLWFQDQDLVRAKLQDLQMLIQGAVAEMRTLLLELRSESLAATPFPLLLRYVTEAASGRSGIKMSITAEEDESLPEQTKLTLYRITQEALANVVKHSRADQVTIQYRCAAQIIDLTITDNGIGFDPDSVTKDRLGLSIMKERAQGIGLVLEISSTPNSGVTLSVHGSIKAPVLE